MPGNVFNRRKAGGGGGGSFEALGKLRAARDADAAEAAAEEAEAPATAASAAHEETSAEAAKRARKKAEREALERRALAAESAVVELAALRGRRKLERSMLTVSWLFLRFLGAVYAVAFASVLIQAHGLIGENGLLPARLWLERVRASHPAAHERVLPTLFWYTGATDGAIETAAFVGVALGALAAANVLAIWPVFFALWGLYLSFYHIGQDFLGFQWDILLLEAGALTLLLAPMWRPLNPGKDRAAGRAQPSRIVIWLFRWLAFRLLISSGIVKLNETWTSLTAMNYHYWTQPIPNPLAWYAHHLPAWWHKVEVWITFLVELPAPIAFFGGRKLRIWNGIVQILFQVGILLTGNYTFFNYLTIALCLFSFDDASLAWIFPNASRLPGPDAKPPSKSRRRAARLLRLAIVAPAAAFVVLASLVPFASLFYPASALPPACSWAYQRAEPLRLVGRYGLFARMTQDRREIVLEGSLDGSRWRPYEFRFKPGNLTRAPPVVAPLQPRLDWQMWFAALSEYPQNPWLIALVHRIFQASPPVLALLASDPFPGSPPAFIRARAYQYRFASAAERAATGAWWTRTELPDYMPTLERGNPSIQQFLAHHGLWTGPGLAAPGGPRPFAALAAHFRWY